MDTPQPQNNNNGQAVARKWSTVITRAAYLAGVSIVLGVLAITAASFLVDNTGGAGGWLLLAGFGGAIFIFPAGGFVLGTLVFFFAWRPKDFLPGLLLGTVVLLILFSWLSWGFIQADSNQPEKKVRQAENMTDCNLVEVREGLWNGCVARVMKTEADFQECRRQAATKPNTLADAVCALEYAIVTKSIDVCLQTASLQSREYCQSNYDPNAFRPKP